MNRSAQTPQLLRPSSFGPAQALQGPLNDVLSSIQQRLAVLEQQTPCYLLGPRRIILPVDASVTPESVVDFQLPEAFTPSGAFVVDMCTADAGTLDVVIEPAALSYVVTGNQLRILRITTKTTTGIPLLLRVGVFRA